jgi:serum/glucocorticoid-regulated kinase 2
MLIQTAFELVELDEKLRDAHPQVKKSKLPATLLSMPMPPKRKSAFLNTLSRLASPGVKLSPAKPSHGLQQPSISTTTPSAANSSVSFPMNGTSNLPSSVSLPSNELNDPFSQVMPDTDAPTLIPPTNPTITSLAAYLTNIANDQIHQQTRVWRRFVRVRTDDLESVRVERAIKRVRSDLAAHLKCPSTEIPSPGSISTSLSNKDVDTVIVSIAELSPFAPEPSPTTDVAKEEVPPPSKDPNNFRGALQPLERSLPMCQNPRRLLKSRRTRF